MNLAWEYLNGTAAQSWSFVLLHFVWQGFVVAACTSLVLHRLRPADSEKRYLVAFVGLVCMAMLPFATYVLVDSPRAAQTSEVTPTSAIKFAAHDFTTGELHAFAAPAGEMLVESETSSQIIWLADSVWYRLRAFLFAVWLFVELILGGRLLLGSVIMWRIRRTAELVSSDLQECAIRLAKKLGLRQVPLVGPKRPNNFAAARSRCCLVAVAGTLAG